MDAKNYKKLFPKISDFWWKKCETTIKNFIMVILKNRKCWKIEQQLKAANMGAKRPVA